MDPPPNYNGSSLVSYGDWQANNIFGITIPFITGNINNNNNNNNQLTESSNESFNYAMSLSIGQDLFAEQQQQQLLQQQQQQSHSNVSTPLSSFNNDNEVELFDAGYSENPHSQSLPQHSGFQGDNDKSRLLPLSFAQITQSAQGHLSSQQQQRSANLSSSASSASPSPLLLPLQSPTSGEGVAGNNTAHAASSSSSSSSSSASSSSSSRGRGKRGRSHTENGDDDIKQEDQDYKEKVRKRRAETHLEADRLRRARLSQAVEELRRIMHVTDGDAASVVKRSADSLREFMKRTESLQKDLATANAAAAAAAARNAVVAAAQIPSQPLQLQSHTHVQTRTPPAHGDHALVSPKFGDDKNSPVTPESPFATLLPVSTSDQQQQAQARGSKTFTYTLDPLQCRIGGLLNADVVMVRTNFAGKVVDINEAFCSCTGFHRTAVIGKRMYQAPMHRNLSLVPSPEYIARCYENDDFDDMDYDIPRHLETMHNLWDIDPLSPTLQAMKADGLTIESVINSKDKEYQQRPVYTHYEYPIPFKSTVPLPNALLLSVSPAICSSITKGDFRTLALNAFKFFKDYVTSGTGRIPIPFLARMHTAFGKTLEAVVNILVIRDSDLTLKSMVMWCTPDSRRLIHSSKPCRGVDKSYQQALDQIIESYHSHTPNMHDPNSNALPDGHVALSPKLTDRSTPSTTE